MCVYIYDLAGYNRPKKERILARELFQRTVSEIHLTRKGEILLKLQNGVFIGEGEAL